MSIGIRAASCNPTIQFAAQELARYVGAISAGNEDKGPFGIKINLFSELFPGQDAGANAFDDGIHIDIQSPSGRIRGFRANWL